jgi:hypothetical protein
MKKNNFIDTTVLLLAFVAVISCKEKTPTELKMELQLLEHNSPLQYLELVETTIQRNKIKDAGLFSSAKYDGFLINGKVKNNATFAKFKDLKLMVEFYSQTKSIIESKSYVKYEYFEPNSIKEFTLKVYPPETMESFGVNVIVASPTYE